MADIIVKNVSDYQMGRRPSRLERSRRESRSESARRQPLHGGGGSRQVIVLHDGEGRSKLSLAATSLALISAVAAPIAADYVETIKTEERSAGLTAGSDNPSRVAYQAIKQPIREIAAKLIKEVGPGDDKEDTEYEVKEPSCDLRQNNLSTTTKVRVEYAPSSCRSRPIISPNIQSSRGPPPTRSLSEEPYPFEEPIVESIERGTHHLAEVVEHRLRSYQLIDPLGGDVETLEATNDSSEAYTDAASVGKEEHIETKKTK